MTRSTRLVDIDIGEKNTCFGTCYLTKKQKYLCCTVIWLPICVLVLFTGGLIVNAVIRGDRFERQILDPNPSFIQGSKDDVTARALRLGKAIKMKTVSLSPSVQNTGELAKINAFITKTYPKLHSASYIEKRQINGHSILFRIEGTEDTLNPYMLCAHLDVVPEGDVNRWDHDPFLGEIIEENGESYIYGRGAIDDKHSVFGILEALEYMVSTDQRPKRTFYVAFGHDEEVSGNEGAGHLKDEIKEMLNENEEFLDFILDEGTMVLKGLFPGTDLPMISISVTEKGWALLDLKVETEQLHASMPSKESAVGILSKALYNMEYNKQPSSFGTGPEYDTIQYTGSHVNFLNKIVLGNLWLFSGLVSKLLSSQPSTDALQRTTTAITRVEAGFKDNVIPGTAKAVVNHRVHPSMTIDEVIENDRKNIGDDRVKITTRQWVPSPKVSPYKGKRAMGFQVVANSALDIFPQARVIPTLMVGNTDTLHYVNLTSNIYRFSPSFMLPEDLERFHGFNERISVKNYNQVVEFYFRVVKNADFAIKIKGEGGSGFGEGSGGKVSAGLTEEDGLLVEEDVFSSTESSGDL